jgi:hypothetical protein
MTRSEIDRLAEANVYAAAYAAHRNDRNVFLGTASTPVSPHEGAREAVRGYRAWRAKEDAEAEKTEVP